MSHARAAAAGFYLLAFAVASSLAAVEASAESLYVIDQLVVGVNSASGEEGERVASIKSGDRVELLDREGDEAHVQLANGTAGWVKGSYLSSEPPTQRRLLDRTAEVEKLKQDVGRLETQLTAARASAAAPRAAPAVDPPPALQASVPAAVPPASSAPVRDASNLMDPPDQIGRPGWLWLTVSSTVALAVGFVAGWRVLDRRIRRKYGGLRIY